MLTKALNYLYRIYTPSRKTKYNLFLEETKELHIPTYTILTRISKKA